ncbi:hypothetical protein ACWCP6_05260 [Streptomyces sp. NPDC002004]
MTERGERFKHALNRIDTVTWFRLPVERHPTYGYQQVSFISWRFANPRSELKAIFESVIQETPLELEWTFRAARNWTLAPTRLLMNSGPDGVNFNQALATLSETDQEFCVTTENDLANLLQALESRTP